eukprot:318168-Pleurochrysis_carterae.AAC.4
MLNSLVLALPETDQRIWQGIVPTLQPSVLRPGYARAPTAHAPFRENGVGEGALSEAPELFIYRLAVSEGDAERVTGVATVAAELDEANTTMQSPGRRGLTTIDNKWANRLAALVFCNMPSAKTFVAQHLTLICHVVVFSVCRCRCRRRLRQRASRPRDGRHKSRWCLLPNHAVAKGIAPELVKCFDGQRERRIAAPTLYDGRRSFSCAINSYNALVDLVEAQAECWIEGLRKHDLNCICCDEKGPDAAKTSSKPHYVGMQLHGAVNLEKLSIELLNKQKDEDGPKTNHDKVSGQPGCKFCKMDHTGRSREQFRAVSFRMLQVHVQRDVQSANDVLVLEEKLF